MKKKFKSAIALIMAFALILSLGAATAFADTGVGDPNGGSNNEAIVVGSFTATDQAYPRYASYVDENLDGITLTDSVSWHNGAIYMTSGSYTISNSTITMDTDADGSDTNDFTGLGAAVMAVGSGVTLTIEDSTITTTGVAKLALFTDNGAVSIVKSSSLTVNGGTIYDGYYSTADQTMMVSPPWVLGLGGDEDDGVNARTTNIMGNYSVGVYIDSDFYAAGWGTLSTDSGTNMTMVVINSTVEVENSGYGAYAIGECTEEYYGVTMDVSTYAIIMCGANATFKSYTGGDEITVYQYSGDTDAYGMGTNGTAVYTASSDEVAEGTTVYSSVTSDNFGFMCHANGSTGYNIVNILDGTSVTSTDAIFLIKKINAIITVDNATLESTEKGVILQIIDNDDDFIGVDATLTWGFDDGYGHTNGTHMPSFNQTFSEEDGYSNEWIADTAAAALYEAGSYSLEDSWTVDYTMTNTTAEGDIWNSSGYVGSNVATTLNVTLGEGASLTGIISAGAFSHDTKYAEVGNGDWSEASALGHVTNIVNSNGVNIVNVTVEDGAVWYVDDNCYIDSLSVDAYSSVVVAEGVTLTVGDEYVYSGETIGVVVVGSNGKQANAPRYASYVNTSVYGITLTDSVSWHNGLVFYGGEGYDNEGGVYYITGATITMDTDADGSDTSDFGGLGAAVAAIGNGITLYIEDTTIETTGVAKLALYTDDGAVSIVKNSTLISNGGVIYDGFYSTADTTMMVSPPWVLGLGGDETEGVNARTTNIMGTNSVGIYIDSTFKASGWGALSTDNGSANTMVVINTVVEVENSGYGAYTIGETTEEYYGSTMDVSTYAIIMTGGEATFESYTAGQEVEVYKMDGDADEYGINEEGTLVATVTSDTAEGTVYSTIVSDNFGFMCHSNGSTGYNVVNILDGTSVTTTDAIFLIKKINAVITVDDATLTSTEKGVILQIIDNDDDYIGVDATLEWGFDDTYGHSYGTHMPTFNQTFSEEDGYSNEWIADTAAAALYEAGTYSTDDNWTVDYTMTNTTVEGDIWNSSGYVGSNVATTLNVTLGEGADLTGIISAGAFSHDTKYAEVGDGDWSGASALGHVTNIVNSTGVNLVNVTLTDDAVWTVSEDSYIDTLDVEEDAVVVIAEDATLTVGDTTYTEGTITSEGYEEAEEDAEGETEAETEAEDEDSDSPETGDSSNLVLWIVLAALALCGGAGIVVKKRFN